MLTFDESRLLQYDRIMLEAENAPCFKENGDISLEKEDTTKMKRMLIILPLLLLLVSCGTSNLNGKTPSQSTTLSVTRINLIPSNKFASFQETVNDAAMIQQLYTAALALPPVSSAWRSCLADAGLRYRLVFHLSTFPSSRMELNPGGCWDLSIEGKKTDVRQMNQAFLSLFSKTIKVSWLGNPSL